MKKVAIIEVYFSGNVVFDAIIKIYLQKSILYKVIVSRKDKKKR